MPEFSVKKRGRPRKSLLEKKATLKNSSQDNWAEDFVFPVFANQKSVNKRYFDQKKSPYVLDLKHKPEQKEPKRRPEIPAFNPDNWFSNFSFSEEERFSDLELLGYRHYRNNFDLPLEPSQLEEKIIYHEPDKHRKKSFLKLNLGQNFLNSDQKISLSKLFFQKFFILRIIWHIWRYFWKIIFFPFKVLDFFVDRTLKLIWRLIKLTVAIPFNLIILIFFSFKKIFLFRVTKEIVAISERPKNFKKFFKPLVTFVLISLAIILPFQVINLKQKSSLIKGQVLGQSMAGFEALKSASSMSQEFDFQGAADAFEQAYFNFSLARKYLDNLDNFSKEVLEFVPASRNGENLIIIGELSAKIGANFTELGKNIDSSNSPGLLVKVEAIKSALDKIEPNFLELKNRVQDIDQEFINRYLDESALKKVTLFQSALPALAENFERIKTLVNFLLNFLGANGAKNYLFVFENNNEIRATGGFMGSFALAEIKNGVINRLEVPGGGFYDLKAGNQILVEAPKPFQIFAPTWQIWNANWFPDWPASAQKISWFYEKSVNGITVDGIISLTPNVLKDLLTMTGEIEMSDYKKIINADNVVRELQEATELEYDKLENKPKKIISDLMPKILAKIFNLKSNQALSFLTLLNKNIAEKNILLWFRDKNMQAVAENFSADGEIKNNNKDFLMVVHTNIGGGKTDGVIKNKINHEVEIDESGKIINTLTLTRTHNGNKEDVFEKQNNVDYVRFYVPFGSKLISASGFDPISSSLFKTPDSPDILKDPDLMAIEKNPIIDENSNTRITEEFNKTVFGNWLMVKPDEEKIVTLKYELPFKFSLGKKDNFVQKIAAFFSGKNKNSEIQNYSLIVQKQPGVDETEFVSKLELPAGTQIQNMDGKNNLENNNGVIYYNDNLKTDGYYEISVK